MEAFRILRFRVLGFRALSFRVQSPRVLEFFLRMRLLKNTLNPKS